MICAVSSPHDDLDARVRAALGEVDDSGEPDDELSALFDAMAGSRHIDIEARRMRERGQGFYTIGSAGHESNAFVAAALHATVPALLHSRSGAFYLARSAPPPPPPPPPPPHTPP